MLSEEQIKKIVSANELAESTALRSKLDGQQAQIESIENQLGEKQKAAKGAEEREFELHQELTGMALLNKQYNELVQDYAYLQSQYKDVLAQLTALQHHNLELEKVAGSMGELQSRLENSLLEKDVLKERINTLEAQKFIKEI